MNCKLCGKLYGPFEVIWCDHKPYHMWCLATSYRTLEAAARAACDGWTNMCDTGVMEFGSRMAELREALPAEPSGGFVNHKDGNPKNHSIENLEVPPEIPKAGAK